MKENNERKRPLRFKAYRGEDFQNKKFFEVVKRNATEVKIDGLPRIDATHIDNERGGVIKAPENSDACGVAFIPGDIVTSAIRSEKRLLLPQFDGIATGAFNTLRPIDTDSKYIFYMLQAERFTEAADKTKGTSRSRIDWELIATLRFSIHKREEQQKIGKLLNLWDRLIRLQSLKFETIGKIKEALINRIYDGINES